MTNAATYLDTEGLSRRDLLRRGLIGGGVVAAALATPGLTGVASAARGKSINLEVDVEGFGSFVQAQADGAPAGVGPFYVGGAIYRLGDLGGESIGEFHCWGFIFGEGTEEPPRAGPGVVNQEFNLTDRGKILIAGFESDAPRAVTGGTGDFANARGEGIPDVDPEFGVNVDHFAISFSLTGALGPPIT